MVAGPTAATSANAMGGDRVTVPAAPLDAAEVRSLEVTRRFGTVGALLMAIGALGAGANPVDNPLFGLRVLGLPTRNYTVSLAIICAGVAMVVLAWLWLGRLARPGRERLLSRGQLDRTVAMWAAPLVLAPPLFSKDVYSYLAQSAMVARGIDPYTTGVAEGMGVADPLVRTIPSLWRDTPAPYGPLFLGLGRGITALAGENVVASVLLHRVLALAGLAMIVWAVPRLARRFGADPVAALWLGAANPLVLFHLVSGVHNEALMIGLMVAGLEVALARSWVLGAVLISLAAMVKVPAVLALAFLGVVLARRWGGRIRDLARAAAVMLGIVAAVTVAIGAGSGLGFGWMFALGTPNAVRSWLSPITDLGSLGGHVGILLGLGDHTDAALSLTRSVGLAAAAGVCVWLLWSCFRDRMDALTGLGVGLGAVVLLGPVVHPWYLLWAAIPLACSATASAPHAGGYRRAAVVLSVALALLVPPTGQDFYLRAFVLLQAIAGAAVILAAPLLLVRGKLPPRTPRVVA
ncbi:MAG TPA: polyprenol phosphomannose-dependent alpha 1,6 mannosyltransferase MptB [Pseudonocardiaceae bacterium]